RCTELPGSSSHSLSPDNRSSTDELSLGVVPGSASAVDSDLSAPGEHDVIATSAHARTNRRSRPVRSAGPPARLADAPRFTIATHAHQTGLLLIRFVRTFDVPTRCQLNLATVRHLPWQPPRGWMYAESRRPWNPS